MDSRLSELKKQAVEEKKQLKNDLDWNIRNMEARFLDKLKNMPFMVSRNYTNTVIREFEQEMSVLWTGMERKIGDFTKRGSNMFSTAASMQGRLAQYSFRQMAEKIDCKKHNKWSRNEELEGYSWFVHTEQLECMVKQESGRIAENLEQYWQKYDEAFQKCLDELSAMEEVQEPAVQKGASVQKESDIQRKTDTKLKTAVRAKSAWAGSELPVLSQIIFRNPVLHAKRPVRQKYLHYLEKYSSIGNIKRRIYAKAQFKQYRRILEHAKDTEVSEKDIHSYALFLLIDFLQMAEYDRELIESPAMVSAAERLLTDLHCNGKAGETALRILSAGKGSYGRLKKAETEGLDFSEEIRAYIRQAGRNMKFQNKKPFKIAVTATMSAGKSTFINAVTGKKISLSQNMACTSKIHAIAGKAFDDGLSYKKDYELILDADERKLLENHEKNKSREIAVCTYFNGMLGGRRILFYDSPGVNFSGDKEHAQITEDFLKTGDYNLLIYLLNATQLGTDDDMEHLRFVKKNCGHAEILFVLNKADSFNLEEEDVTETLKRAKAYLEQHGFQEPMVCPVSAKAGYLAKKSLQTELSQIQRMELMNLAGKFKRMHLPEYYEEHFPEICVEDREQEELQLLKNCGLSYVELFIKKQCKGEKKNGTSICEIQSIPAKNTDSSEWA